MPQNRKIIPAESDSFADLARAYSAKDLAAWGAADVAYVKRAKVEGRVYWAIFSADGRQVGAAETQASALAAIHQNDLEPISLH